MENDESSKTRLTPRERAATRPKSAQLAIAAYCYHVCMGEEAQNSHTTKLMIKECAKTDCPLWPHRGWRKITGGNVGKKHWKHKQPDSPLAQGPIPGVKKP